MGKIPLLVIAGPTASGKTALAVELAREYGGEVVSADSMQIYEGMDIATAKPDEAEKREIPHHLISFVKRSESFSVADYVNMAHGVISDIHSRNKLPILAGGTGLYISSLIDNIDFNSAEASDESVRKRLTEEAELLGYPQMLERLKKVDPETASALHCNNIGRIIRALEVFETTGVPLSEHKRISRMTESPYNTCVIGITCRDRQKLYDKINLRVLKMAEAGLVEEERRIYEESGLKTAHQAIGYKELIPYFDGSASLEECIEKIQQETRRYAKRQLTWFRRDERVNWIFTDDYPSYKIFLENVKKIIAISGIL